MNHQWPTNLQNVSWVFFFLTGLSWPELKWCWKIWLGKT